MKKSLRHLVLCILSFSAVLAVTLAMSGCSVLGIHKKGESRPLNEFRAPVGGGPREI